MSSSRTAAFLVLSTLTFAGASSLAITACSSSSNTDSGTGDSGSTTPPPPAPKRDAAPVDNDSGTTQTPQECYQACLDAHPTAKAAYTSVDTCWANNCQGPCYDQTGVFDGGTMDAGDAGTADAGDGGDAGDGVCGTTTGTGQDMACDQCTTTFCCSQWADCYTTHHDECAAIDSCLGNCPTQ